MAKHDKLDATQREEAAKFYGDAAMKLLRDAVSKAGPTERQRFLDTTALQMTGRVEEAV